LLFASLPATSNYQLNSYGFGNGGSAGSSTSTYALEGISGEISGATSTTTNYNLKPGFIESQQASAPAIKTFDNGSSTYYNKLHFVIEDTLPNNPNFPSDTLFALQISTTSNFSSNVNYVKSDLTIGASLNTTDYQTYITWGGSSGSNIIGLSPNTTYYLRAKAAQHLFSQSGGRFTESGYGPSLSASTVNPSLSFSVSPSSVNIGSLLVNTVVDSPTNISITFATNAASGGAVYANGQNATAGLHTTKGNSTIPSATGDLSSLSHGFGAQISGTPSQISKVSPYDGSAGNVGVIDTSIRKIFSASAPVTSGSGTVLLKAKSAYSDPAEADYTETVTFVAAATF